MVGAAASRPPPPCDCVDGCQAPTGRRDLVTETDKRQAGHQHDATLSDSIAASTRPHTRRSSSEQGTKSWRATAEEASTRPSGGSAPSTRGVFFSDRSTDSSDARIRACASFLREDSTP